ncbi:hypothetical protein GOODEAATRI_030744, partial [Goodea atripinnis]
MVACASCGVPLQVEDGHDLCPKCLGVGHLREALTDPCMNCSILPLPVRENRLRQVENLLFVAELPPSGMPQPCSGRQGDAPAEECRSPRRKRPRLERPSRQEVDSLRAEVEQLKAPEPTPAFQAAAAWESGGGPGRQWNLSEGLQFRVPVPRGPAGTLPRPISASHDVVDGRR